MTRTPRRLLVPLDGSDPSLAAIPWVRALSSKESHLTLLQVISAPLPMLEIAGASTVSYEAIREHHLDTACAWLEGVANGLTDVAGNITRLARLSTPADEILDVVDQREIHMIVMATHGRGAAGRIVTGSVADRVARAASVPVMLVPASGTDTVRNAGTTARARRLVVPLDGSDRARSALPVAATLASMLEAPIHLARVVPSRDALFASRDALETGELYQRLVYATPVLPRPEHDDAYYEGYCASLEDALRAEAGKLRMTGVETTSELLIGPTAPTLLDEIHRGDVVVMTSHGEGGIRRWMLGSVAEKLIHQATAPVVLVPNAERQALLSRS